MAIERALVNDLSNQSNPWAREPQGVCVRLLSPLGTYPANTGFRSPDAAIIVADDTIALVTKFWPIHSPVDSFSEVEFLSAFEVRVLTSLLISREPESGGIHLYPVSTEYRNPDASVDLSDESVLAGLLDCFRRRLLEYGVSSIAHRPPCLGGSPYNFNPYPIIRHERYTEIVAAVDVNDHVAIRGLGAIIKAGMLACHSEFLEQACMSLWISLDASFALIQRRLRKKGHPNPSARDAGSLLDVAFENKCKSDGYFEDFYEERVKTLHPENRFGTYPAAPLNADEYFLLNESLLAVYDFLLTGHVAPEWKGR